MFVKFNLNELSTVNKLFALVIICLVVPCDVDGGITDSVVSRTSGLNVLLNMFGMSTYENHTLTSALDIDKISKNLFYWVRSAVRRYSGQIGARRTGNYLQRPLPQSDAFPCNTAGQRSQVVPDSVHQLRPGDIDIVAAMGDSVTVGTGGNAVNAIEVLNDQRGLSFSGGGFGNFRTHLTVPNILKEFNPQLFGYDANGWLQKLPNSLIRYALDDAWSIEYNSQFNVAENGAAATDMPFMASKLLRRMRSDGRVNMETHWKLLTIMIGTNDFCSDICYQNNGPLWMNREIEENIIKTLRIIRDQMPRTLINLVTHPTVSLVLSMDSIPNLPTYCQIGRLVQCTCMEGHLYSQHKKLYMLLEQEYRQIFQRIARRPEFHRNDFTVVFQPFGVNATVFLHDRKPDINIMAVDCLHLSQKGQAIVANALWNNMMQSDGRKSVGLKPLYEEFECPSEQNPYIKTYFNS